MTSRQTGAVALSLLFGVLVALSSAYSAMIPPENVALKRLPNGLTVAVAEDHSAPVVAVRIYVKAGAIYEQEYLGCGISHFVEHVESDGTDGMTKAQIEHLSDEFGGQINAYTSSDHTCYHASAPSIYFDKVLFLLSHCFTRAAFPDEEVETQRGVIENEIAKDLDEPMRLLWRLMMSTMFKEHPARYPTIGDKQLFSQLTRDDLVAYYHRMYVPENSFVVVVGDVDASETLQKLETAFKDFAARPFSPVILPSEPTQLNTRKATHEMDVELAYLMLGYRSIPLQHPDLYALDVLAAILGTGKSARLVQTLKDKECLVQDITASSWTARYGIGAFFVRAALLPENMDKVVEAVNGQLESIKREKVSEAELKKAKKLIKSHYLLEIDTMEQKASVLGSDLLATGEVGMSWRYLDGIAGVTADQVLEAANKYLDSSQLCVTAVVPRSAGEDTTKQVAKPTTKRIPIQKTVLPNGLRLLTQHGDIKSTVSIDAYFLGGTRFETEATNGVANLMTSLLLKGTKSRTAEDLALEIDLMGAKIAASSDMNTFRVSLELLQEDLEKGLELLADIIMNPKFDAEQFEREKKNALSVIKRRSDLWYVKPTELMLSRLYTAHPYRMSNFGSLESVEKLTVDDVWEYYDAYVKPDNMVLSIFSVASNEVGSLVEKCFSGFEGVTSLPSLSLDPAPTANVEIADTSRWNQAVVCYGFRSCDVANQDKYALDVLDAALSGIYLPGGRLHARLRDNQLVYLIHAYNRMGVDPGWFVIYASALPKNIDRVQDVIEAEVAKITGEPVGEDELRIAKGMCISAEVVRRLQTAPQQSAAASLGELYGLGYDSYLQYEDRIQAVSAQDVKEVASKYLTNHVKVKVVPKLD